MYDPPERHPPRRSRRIIALAATMLAALAISPQVGLSLGFWTLAATCMLAVVLVEHSITATVTSTMTPKLDARRLKLRAGNVPRCLPG